MILRWYLNKFKSVSTPTDLPLRPLTVFAGPNSSGKSSMLQSVLLIAQTLTSKIPRRHLVLNGDILKLGTFSDVVSDTAGKDQSLEIGFDLGIDYRRDLSWRNAGARSASRPRQEWLFDAPVSGSEHNVRLTFVAASDSQRKADAPSRLNAQLQQAHYTTTYFSPSPEATQNTSPRIKLDINRRDNISFEDLTSAVFDDLVQAATDPEDLRYEIAVRPSSAFDKSRYRRRATGYHAPPDIVACGLEHFVPRFLVNRYEYVSRALENALDDMLDHPSYQAARLCDEWLGRKSNPARQVVAQVTKDYADKAGVDVQQYIRALRSPRQSRHSATIGSPADILDASKERLGQIATTGEYAVERLPLPDDLDLLYE